MKPRITPTIKLIEALIAEGYIQTAVGGSGYILPRYWIFKRPDGSTFIACKTKTLKEELLSLKQGKEKIS